MTLEERQQVESILVEHGHNPLCAEPIGNATHFGETRDDRTGDRFSLQLEIGSDGCIEALGWEASGSVVLKASASLLSALAVGRHKAEILGKIARFLENLTSPEAPAESAWDGLGDAYALGGIRQFPARVRCASLPWRTLQKVILEDGRNGDGSLTNGDE